MVMRRASASVLGLAVSLLTNSWSQAEPTRIVDFFSEACLLPLPDLQAIERHPILTDAPIERQGRLCEASYDRQTSFKNWGLDHIFGPDVNFVASTRSVFRQSNVWGQQRPFRPGQEDTPGVIFSCSITARHGDLVNLAQEIATAAGARWNEPDARTKQASEWRLWSIGPPQDRRFLEIAIRDQNFGEPGGNILNAKLLLGRPEKLECPIASRALPLSQSGSDELSASVMYTDMQQN